VLLGCGLELQLDAENNDENTPLHLAIKGGYLEVITVFWERGICERLGLNRLNRSFTPGY